MTGSLLRRLQELAGEVRRGERFVRERRRRRTCRLPVRVPFETSTMTGSLLRRLQELAVVAR